MSDGKTKKELLVQSRWFLLAVALLTTLVLSITYWLVQPEIPDFGRPAKLFAVTFFVGALFAAPWASKLVDWLYTPDVKYLLTTNAETNELQLWKLPLPLWRDLDIEEDLHLWDASRHVYEAREFDQEENRAVGTWRGSATDLELVEHRENVKEVRGDLEELAREGLAIRAKQSSIVRASVSDIVMEFVGDFEVETMYSGEQIQNRVEDALADLDDESADPDDDDQDESNPLLEAFEQSNDSPDTQNDGNQ